MWPLVVSSIRERVEFVSTGNQKGFSILEYDHSKFNAPEKIEEGTKNLF